MLILIYMIDCLLKIYFLIGKIKKINIFNCLHDIRRKNKTEEILIISPTHSTSSLDKLVNMMVILFNEKPNLSILDFLQNILMVLETSNPGIVKDLPVNVDQFKFSLFAMSSIFSMIKNINQHMKSCKEKSDLINKILSSVLFDNDSSPSDSEINRFFELSSHFIDIARKNVKAYKEGSRSDFSRSYCDRETFSRDTITMIQDFFDEHTIFCDGNQMVSKRQKKGRPSIRHPMKLIPCTIQEFYELFVLLHGEECMNAKNEHRIPKISFFMNLKPFYIRPLRKFKTGYCSICMEAKELLKTFRKILTKICKCKSLFCDDFQHEEDCKQELNEDGTCKECTSCSCNSCNLCKVLEITNSLDNFLNYLKCEHFFLDGRKYSSVKCLKQECKKCGIKNYEDLLNRFCKTAMKNFDPKARVTTKVWKEEEIRTTTKCEKFKVWVLENKEMEAGEFLNFFVQKLTEKRGILWHHDVAYYQRNQFNKMVRNMMAGKYGTKTAIIVTDWSENYGIKDGRKLTSDQYFKQNKCQILGMVIYYHDGDDYHADSNFVLSDLDVKRDAFTAVDEIRKRIEELKIKKGIDNILVWSDGSTTEFLCKHIFGNLGKLSSLLNINLSWNYFGNFHGKSICDSEFARYKTALDRELLKDKRKFTNAEDIYNFCQEGLNFFGIPMKGKLKMRNYFYRSKEETSKINYETRYNTARDTKLYRNSFWSKEGTWLRRHNSCACLSCVTLPTIDTSKVCPQVSITGNWEKYRMRIPRKYEQPMPEVVPDKECCI